MFENDKINGYKLIMITFRHLDIPRFDRPILQLLYFKQTLAVILFLLQEQALHLFF